VNVFFFPFSPFLPSLRSAWKGNEKKRRRKEKKKKKQDEINI